MTRSYLTLHARIASRITVAVCGVSTTAIGSTSLLGYMVGMVGLYHWPNSTIGMALNTAIGFVLSGLALAVISASNRVWRCS